MVAGSAAAIAAWVGAAAAVAGAVVSYTGQKRAAKKAKRAREEAAAISAAREKIERQRNQRRAIKERRIIAAKIQQNSENLGVGGSSGETGAGSALNTNLGGNIAFDSGRALGVAGINNQNQIIADAQGDANRSKALGNLISSVGDAVSSFSSGASFNPSNNPGPLGANTSTRLSAAQYRRGSI